MWEKSLDVSTFTYRADRIRIFYVFTHLITDSNVIQTGQIKGRGCADSRQQRIYSHKEDASSLTVMIESVMLTSVIDIEERDVATVDIPGAFLQADMDEILYVRMTDNMVNILSNIDSKYGDYITQEVKKKVLYVQLHKALYGTMQATLMFGRNYHNNYRSGGSN
jgi:hypothetical protein